MRARLTRGCLACCLWTALAASVLLPAASHAIAVRDFRLEGDNPLGPEATEAVLAPYRGDERGLEDLQAAARALQSALHAAGWGLYRVVLPPQDVTDVVVLRILRSELASVEVTGGSEAAVRRALPSLREGDSPNLRRLARELAQAGENPSREMSVKLRALDQPDAVGATVDVTEHSPWSGFLQLDNTGSPLPARSRLTLGVRHSNLFGLDHALTGVGVTSPEAAGDVRQGGLLYRAPLYAVGGELSAIWFRSSVDSGVVADAFTVSGQGRFTGLGYTQRMLPTGAWSSSMRIGVDDKVLEDQTRFLGTPIGGTVRSRPASLGYRLRGEMPGAVGEAQLEWVRNLPGGAHNDDIDYALARLGARRSWQALRFDAEGAADLPAGLRLSARLRAQWADQALIAAEQMGVGGPDSLRGLESRQLLGDRGVETTLSLAYPMHAGTVTPVVFWGGARVDRESAPPGTLSRETVSNVGLGLRLRPRQAVSLSLDWARVTDGAQGIEAGQNRVYGQIVTSF